MAENAILTTDMVIFTIQNHKLKVLLIKRKKEPYKHMYALPGGIVEKDEQVEQTATRELQEETGLKNIFLKKFNVYSDVGRDPRGRFVSVAFFGLVKPKTAEAGDDAEATTWRSVFSLPKLAFDHKRIIRDALNNLKHEVLTSNIIQNILPGFTIKELQTTYEIILNKRTENFYKNLKPLLKEIKPGIYTFRYKKFKELPL